MEDRGSRRVLCCLRGEISSLKCCVQTNNSASALSHPEGLRPDKSRYAILHAIERLDSETDHQRIIFLSGCETGILNNK